MWKHFTGVLLSLMLIAGAAASCAGETERLAPSANWYMPPNPRTFAEFLTSGQDLVVTGTIRSASETVRGYARVPELIRSRVTEVELDVNEVLFGSAPGERIEITLSDGGYGFTPGDHILVWANYTWEDNWRLRGRARKIEDGQLLARDQEPVFVEEGRPQMSLSYATVRASLQTSVHPSTVFNGMRGLILMHLRGSTRWSPSGAMFEVDSLSVVMGQVESAPHKITFPALAGCSPGVYPGDSLLVPVPPGFRGDVLQLNHCPSALRIKDCFVPGLGINLSDLKRSLDSSGPMLHVRAVQLQGE